MVVRVAQLFVLGLICALFGWVHIAGVSVLTSNATLANRRRAAHQAATGSFFKFRGTMGHTLATPHG
jgi:hypothetical protein